MKNNIFAHNGGEKKDSSLAQNVRLKICPKTCVIEQRNAGGVWKRYSSFSHPVKPDHAARLKSIYDLTDEAVAKITGA